MLLIMRSINSTDQDRSFRSSQAQSDKYSSGSKCQKKCEKIRFTRGKNQLNCSNPAGIFQAYSLFLIGTFMHTCGHSLPCPCQWWRGAHLQMESGLCRSPAASRERKAPGACWAWTQPTRLAGKDVQIKQKIGKIHMKCLQNMYICLSMYPSIFLSVCLAVWFFVRLSIRLSIYPSIYVIHFYICLCVRVLHKFLLKIIPSPYC